MSTAAAGNRAQNIHAGLGIFLPDKAQCSFPSRACHLILLVLLKTRTSRMPCCRRRRRACAPHASSAQPLHKHEHRGRSAAPGHLRKPRAKLAQAALRGNSRARCCCSEHACEQHYWAPKIDQQDCYRTTDTPAGLPRAVGPAGAGSAERQISSYQPRRPAGFMT